MSFRPCVRARSDGEQLFFRLADPLVASAICERLDFASLQAIPLSIRSLTDAARHEFETRALARIQSMEHEDELKRRFRRSMPKVLIDGRRLSALGPRRLVALLPKILPLLESNHEGARYQALYAVHTLSSSVLAQHLPVLLGLVAEHDHDIRDLAGTIITRLDAADLEPRVPMLLDCLRTGMESTSEIHNHFCLRIFFETAMFEVLARHKLLEPHAACLVALISEPKNHVLARTGALKQLTKLRVPVVAPHLDTIAKIARCDPFPEIRVMAYDALLSLGDMTLLGPHVPSFLEDLSDSKELIRDAANTLLEVLPSSVLEAHEVALLKILQKGPSDARRRVIALLGKLSFKFRNEHLPKLLLPFLQPRRDRSRAQDTASLICSVFSALRELDPSSLTPLIPTILHCLSHAPDSVRYAAVTTLSYTEPGALARHVPCLLQALSQSWEREATRRPLLEVLGRLDAQALGPHAPALMALFLRGDWAPTRRSVDD